MTGFLRPGAAFLEWTIVFVAAVALRFVPARIPGVRAMRWIPIIMALAWLVSEGETDSALGLISVSLVAAGLRGIPGMPRSSGSLQALVLLAASVYGIGAVISAHPLMVTIGAAVALGAGFRRILGAEEGSRFSVGEIVGSSAALFALSSDPFVV